MSSVPPLESLLILNGVVASCSFLAELYVVIYFCRNKQDLADLPVKLIFSLILADFLGSMIDLTYFYDYSQETICVLAAYLRQISILSSLFWICSMTHYNLYFMTNDVEPKYWKYCLTSTLIPFALSTWVVLGNVTKEYNGYQFQGIACSPSAFISLFTIDIPCLAMMIYTIVQYIRIIILIPKFGISVSGKKLMLYPVTVIICSTPGLFTKILEIFTGGYVPTFMFVLYILGLKSIGFVNSMFLMMQRNGFRRSVHPEDRIDLTSFSKLSVRNEDLMKSIY